MDPQPIHVQCVYGESHLPHIRNSLIPALRKTSDRPVRLLAINYDPRSSARLASESIDGVEIVDVANTADGPTGFAGNHNTLFEACPPAEAFVLLNPDCIPQPGAIDTLLKRKASGSRIGIVEGRQWPFEHPKEYDPLSLETPWASGAFALVDAGFYRSIGGMDDLYFLYLEDVDLSWQAWLNGYRVLYEPAAAVSHFTGGRFYRDDMVSHEQYLSLRNFLIIARKFFGEAGEQRALAMLHAFSDKELAEIAIAEYFGAYRQRVSEAYAGKKHPKVKILGLNLFHQLRAA